ncbi:MAG: hypothetical protein M0R66_03800 [Candidatus Omnitrophica bacterium]|nr:hypothetical protein [Candidatus Omnitrophota bacterium]
MTTFYNFGRLYRGRMHDVEGKACEGDAFLFALGPIFPSRYDLSVREGDKCVMCSARLAPTDTSCWSCKLRAVGSFFTKVNLGWASNTVAYGKDAVCVAGLDMDESTWELTGYEYFGAAAKFLKRYNVDFFGKRFFAFPDRETVGDFLWHECIVINYDPEKPGPKYTNAVVTESNLIDVLCEPAKFTTLKPSAVLDESDVVAGVETRKTVILPPPAVIKPEKPTVLPLPPPPVTPATPKPRLKKEKEKPSKKLTDFF